MLGQRRFGGDHQARLGLDLAGQSIQRRLGDGLGEPVQRRVGDRLGAGHRQGCRALAVFMGDAGQLWQRLAAGERDLGEGVGLARGDAFQRLAFPFGQGGGADAIHLLQRIEAFWARRGLLTDAGAVEDSVEAEAFQGGGHQ